MDCYSHYQRDINPSFSSTLLDAIYRSIDEPNYDKQQKDSIFNRENLRKKHNSHGLRDEKRFNKTCMIDKWIEDKVSYETFARKNGRSDSSNSSSSSSESSSGGGWFSSSEHDSVQRPKPIRTGLDRSVDEGSFVKTKSKALKFYGNLKKVKQPISPGGRLTTFLNSLFTTGNGKKVKGSSPTPVGFQSTYTCPSISKSCLSKTPSSRGNETKRSVRFVDESSRACGRNSLYATHHAKGASNSERVLKREEFGQSYGDQDDDDDVMSYASSDLFELDNLCGHGIDMYREELPVYETTHLGTNRAITNRLVL